MVLPIFRLALVLGNPLRVTQAGFTSVRGADEPLP